MLESESKTVLSDAEREALFRRTPAGALLIAGVSTAVVLLLWALFYIFVFLPRGMLQ
ncbi:MAG TPA: hypothetical protein VGV09_00900 [Steroidobacteraceae bacterium]|nr:hypothetical protein [Steroidobacteraceae bacterium]